jgi:thioesterase domain-containing protein
MRANHFLRLNAKAEVAYEPQVYPGRIWIFSGEDLYDDPELGWGGLAEGGVESHVVPGDHSNNRQMMNEPHVQVVGERLKAVLSAADRIVWRR